MYVTYFALLSIGAIWNSWISLVTFISLIVFQSMINSDQWSITSASIYIRIFFEEQRNDIHWELLHADSMFSLAYEAANENLGWYFRKYGASFLAMFSLLAILLPPLRESGFNFYNLSLSDLIQIMFAFILCILTIYVNHLYFSLRNNNGNNAQRLSDAVRLFYDKFEESEKEV